MTNHRQLLTSLNQDWRTPKKIYEELNKEFNFDFDPCPENPDFNGLEVEWGKSNFLNPPYKTKIQDAFVAKAFEEWKKGKTVILLIPVRTASRRWQNFILNEKYRENVDIRFLPKRLKFDNPKRPGEKPNHATFDSAVIVLRGEVHE